MSGETRSSESGTTLSAGPASTESVVVETSSTRHESSIEPPLTSEQERFVSTSVLDDSILRLHLQMRRLTFSPASPRVYDAPVDVDDASEVLRAKLACQTAMAMGKLVKTKIDAVRVFKKGDTR